ncbi:MAG TPA: DUF58 domain-containing protein [Spirochaetia bacterium]|nr:DUF58 domain-containing protein [Spirochaetia bacterium]
MSAGAIFGLIISAFLVLFIPLAPMQWVGIFFLAVILLSKTYSVAIRRSLNVTRSSHSINVFKFQPAVVEISLSNRGMLPIPYLSVFDDAGNLATRDQNRGVLALGGNSEASFSYTLKGYNRGVYELGPVRLRASDPLGLFPWSATWQLRSSLVVYPSVYPITLKTDHGVPAGSVRVWNPVYEDITNYRSIREYVSGDDPRRINWKVSARTGSLQTMQFLPAIGFPVMVLLDLNADHYAVRNRYVHTERAIEAAASIVQAAANIGQAVGLQVTGGIAQSAATAAQSAATAAQSAAAGSVPIAQGFPHATAILELLARVVVVTLPTREGPVEHFVQSGVRLPAGTWLCYVGPTLSEEQRQHLSGSAVTSRTTLFYVDEGVRPPDSLYDGLFRVRWVRSSGEDIVD